jgi:predicted nucleic acid-binding protein
MRAYVDSSVLLRILLGEPNALRSFRRIKLGISSDLLRVECFRVIDRLRLKAGLSDGDVAALHEELQRACAAMEFVRISPLLLGMASQPFPTNVRTLDALHLASAMLWSQSRDLPLIFLTHDKQLAIGARSLGFSVDGI